MRGAGSVKPTPPQIRPRKKRRGNFHHGDLAEQLALTAASLIESKGHAELSLKKMAAHLGVTEPSLYRHYASRDDLLAEVASRGLVEFLAFTLAAGNAHEDPFDSIRAYGRAYVRYCAQHPGWFRLMFSRFGMEGLMQYPRAVQRLQAIGDDRATTIALWRRALPPGDERIDDLYRLLWGTANGLAALVVDRVFQLAQTTEARVAAADDSIDLLVESLRFRAQTR